MTKTLSGKLALINCQNQLCSYGTWENDMHCIVELEKLDCLVIRVNPSQWVKINLEYIKANKISKMN